MPAGYGYPKNPLIEQIRRAGSEQGDTILAHISPEEADHLKNRGGAGVIDGDTGLPKFYFDASDFAGDWSGYDAAGGDLDVSDFVAQIMGGPITTDDKTQLIGGAGDEGHRAAVEKATEGMKYKGGIEAFTAMAKREGRMPETADFGMLAELLGQTPQQAAQHQATGAFNQALEAGHADPAQAVLDMISGGSFFNEGDFADNYTNMLNEQAKRQNIQQLATTYHGALGRQYEDLPAEIMGAHASLEDDPPEVSVDTALSDLTSAIEAMDIKDFNTYESPLSAAMRGAISSPTDFNSAQVMELGLGMAPGLGTAMGLGGLLGKATGQEVIGTFSQNGIGYNLHQDGNITLASPSPGADDISAYGSMSDLQGIASPVISGAAGFDRESALRNTLQGLIADEGIGEFRSGLTPDQLDYILTNQLMAQNTALGEDVTEADFNRAFGGADLGRQLLLDEEGQRQEGWRTSLGETFTGEAFAPDFDDDIIDSIIESRIQEPRQQISNVAARGNLNPFGGRTANTVLGEQEAGARERAEQVSGSILGETQRSINDLRNTALTGITGFRLGDEPFDFSPALSGRQDLVANQRGSLRSDIDTSLGSEPLFDPQGALSAGGRSQGVVSGGGTRGNLLDTIAQRESVSRGEARRGLGSRGSGAF